ncbi:HotDog domain-containing protein [Apodospora peruviana]|uniref:HotDog domain-containing protein n=1 Tax=Apodospora peruviana TaxID=516989 RepID=A0AAE0IJ43_9PEZI|nr:HotDog domain-containing protein [Apodospora peruviana]
MATSEDEAAAAAVELAHFRAIPWCAAHLSAPDVVIDRSFSRRPKPKFEDALLSYTLNRPDAIPAFVTFYRPPPPQEGPQALVTEVKAFLSLGNLVNGWAGICHGGIVMTILDEVMGQIPAVNKLRGVMENIPLMTAFLNTTFLKPVKTPTTVLVTGKLVRREGRKYYIDGLIEDENGTALARAEALFVMLKARL